MSWSGTCGAGIALNFEDTRTSGAVWSRCGQGRLAQWTRRQFGGQESGEQTGRELGHMSRYEGQFCPTCPILFHSRRRREVPLAGHDPSRFNGLIRTSVWWIMSPHREIIKIGLAVTDGSRLLLVRKRGGRSYILPGGKPEQGEDDFQALEREVEEELGCRIDSLSVQYLGAFSDVAADLENTVVTVRLYAARLIGLPAPTSEIEQLEWFAPEMQRYMVLAPSLQNKIVPFLCEHGRL